MKRLLAALLLLAPLSAHAADTFFWRAEGTTLTSDDFSAADTTATANSTVSISGTCAKVGSNGVCTTNSSDWYEFASSSIAITGQGAMGGWIQFKTSMPDLVQTGPVALRNAADSTDVIAIGINVDEPRLRIQRSGGSSLTLSTTGCNLVVDTWYYIIVRWNISADDRKVECYNSSGALIDSNEDTSTDLAGAEPVAIDELRVGGMSTTNPVWIDNVHVSQTYAEPIENFLSITSFKPAYSAGPTLTGATSSTLPFVYTPNQNGTTYLAVCTNGQTSLSWSNLKAGTCSGGAAVASASDTSTAGNSDTVTGTGLSSGTVYDCFIGHESTIGGQSAIVTRSDCTTSGGGGVTFDTPPAVTSQTTDTYTIGYDTAGAGNFFVGAYKKDSPDPTCDNIEAGTGTGFVVKATEAATNSADSIALAITGGDPFPLYDLHACAEDGGGTTDSTVVHLYDEALDEPTGRNYVTKSGSPGGGEEGILDGASPAAADGDIMDVAERADSAGNGPEANALSVNADTTFEIDIQGDLSRQTFTRRFYDVSAGGWSDASPVLYCVRNVFPEYTGPEEYEGEVPYLFEEDASVSFSLDGLWQDTEGDDLTHNIVNLPAGASEDGEEITGAFTTQGTYPTVELQVFDICGDESDETVTFVVGARVPDIFSAVHDALIRQLIRQSANDSYYFRRHSRVIGQ